ncbi:hypothetical protein HDV03_000981 [Kappamyces sp. JEL0829]|nr:hypothetical protein HDV03_000981 [Kappamyces sp. JEL0829]
MIQVQTEVEKIWNGNSATRKAACAYSLIKEGVAAEGGVVGLASTSVFSSRAATAESRFQAASMSKPIAGFVCMLLVQRGLLDLDVDVNTYLTGVDYKLQGASGQVATLRQLLSHSAGTSISGFLGYNKHVLKKLPSSLEIVQGQDAGANHPKITIETEQGKYLYSGGGIQVAQLVMETVAGKPFGALAHELVFEPLGMDRSTFQVFTDDGAGERTHMHWQFPWDSRMFMWYWILFYYPALPFRLYPESAAAGLWTTAPDYVKFLIELRRSYLGLDGALLRQDLAKEMCTGVVSTSTDDKAMMGLCIALDGNVASHTGSNVGFSCKGAIDLVTGNGFCHLSNFEGPDNRQVTKELHALFRSRVNLAAE